MKFSIKDSFSKCDQIRSFLRIWSHLPKESLMEKFIFCVVTLKSETIFSNWRPFKNDEECFFHFPLKTLFVLKMFRFLSWHFGHVKKRLDYKYQVNFKIYLWGHNLVNKQLQYTYGPISQEVMSIRL